MGQYLLGWVWFLKYFGVTYTYLVFNNGSAPFWLACVLEATPMMECVRIPTRVKKYSSALAYIVGAMLQGPCGRLQNTPSCCATKMSLPPAHVVDATLQTVRT